MAGLLLSGEANYSDEDLNGRIVVVWDPLLAVVFYYKSPQLVLCGVHNPITNQSLSVAFAYGFYTATDRQPLWDSIRLLAASPILSQSPWLVLGDFNQVLGSNELYSLIPYSVSISGMLDFQSCLYTSLLSDLPYRGCFLTWMNKQPLNSIARKLDRALCNEPWLDAFPLSVAEFDAPGPSDHSPCHVTLEPFQAQRKVPFKYFSFFYSHPEYSVLMQEAWLDIDCFEPGFILLCKRLRSAKYCCKHLNRNKFGNIQRRVKEAADILHSKQTQLLNHPSQVLFEEREARDSWLFWSAIVETFYRQKSRVRWLGDGDANTAFFHKSVQANLSKNIIHHLRTQDNVKVIDLPMLKTLVEQFYFQLLGVSNTSVQVPTVQCIKAIHPFRCTQTLSQQLLALPSSEEIRATVFGMPRNKAPGPDGFSVEFFISSWSLVGADVVAAVLEFFVKSLLPRQVNATILTLIPKVIGADRLVDFRPIACCNTVYKIISRILANRLKLFINDAVQLNQVGFVPGRLLCENVLLASELVSDFHKPSPVTRGCLQIDLTKAYDKLEWTFILNILRALDLPAKFIGWIKLCISTPSFSVALNGELVGFFPGRRGLRQGDPISSSLFALAMDVLSKQLDLAAISNRFGVHPQCSSPLVTHLSFADDVLIFFDGSLRSLQGILTVLDQFYTSSGLEVNLQKTLIFVDGGDPELVSELASTCGVTQGDLPVRYLGLPLLPHKMRPQDYQPLLDKVTARVSSWLVRHLSFAGRLQLVQSVLYGIINFWASVFPLPKSCLRALEKICSAFLWSGAPNSARGAKISWESVCTPKDEGGLGLRRLEPWHQVFGLKLIWMLFTKAGSLWVSWTKENLLRGRLFWDSPLASTGSWLWKRLLKLRDLARPFLTCSVRSGASALFWHDNWTGLGPLISITRANGPRVLGITRMATVSQVIRDGEWALPRGRHPIITLIRSCLPAVPILQPGNMDFHLWKNSPSAPPGLFSSSQTWATLQPVGQKVSWVKEVWFSQRIPKHAFILWIVMRGRLVTRDRLLSWSLQVPSDCLLCNSRDESSSHLFFSCPYSKEVWLAFFTHPTLSPPLDLFGIVSWVGSASRFKKVNIISKLILQATIYELWKERNGRVHGAAPRHHSLLIKDIQLLLRARLLSLDRKDTMIDFSANPATQPSCFTYLSTWFGFFQFNS